MYISQETPAQTETRLKQVLQQAHLKTYDGAYFFQEFPLDRYEFDRNALAIVRDEEVWSQLIKASEEHKNKELFYIFSFHFKDGFDNSGFVGWLASTIKHSVGSGVFVICGQNTNKGGIFDYWGCPFEIRTQVIELINDMRVSA